MLSVTRVTAFSTAAHKQSVRRNPHHEDTDIGKMLPKARGDASADERPAVDQDEQQQLARAARRSGGLSMNIPRPIRIAATARSIATNGR